MTLINANNGTGRNNGSQHYPSRGSGGKREVVFKKRPAPGSWCQEGLNPSVDSDDVLSIARDEFTHCEGVRETALRSVTIMDEMVISPGKYFGLPASAVYLDQLHMDGHSNGKGSIELNPLDWEIFPDLIGFKSATIIEHGASAESGLVIVLTGNGQREVVSQASPANQSHCMTSESANPSM